MTVIQSIAYYSVKDLLSLAGKQILVDFIRRHMVPFKYHDKSVIEKHA